MNEKLFKVINKYDRFAIFNLIINRTEIKRFCVYITKYRSYKIELTV